MCQGLAKWVILLKVEKFEPYSAYFAKLKFEDIVYKACKFAVPFALPESSPNCHTYSVFHGICTYAFTHPPFDSCSASKSEAR